MIAVLFLTPYMNGREPEAFRGREEIAFEASLAGARLGAPTRELCLVVGSAVDFWSSRVETSKNSSAARH